MMTDEHYRIRKARGTSIRAFFPIIGLILIIAFGAIAYYLGPILADAVDRYILIPNEQWETFQWISRGIVFLILLLITTLLYAIAAPKRRKQVSERDLERERKAKIQAQLDAKKRQKQVRARLAEERRKNNPLEKK